jgi:cytochrome c oxidase subunit 4
MSDHHHHAEDHGHHEHPHVNYMKIFWMLLFLTLAEYFYAMLTQSNFALLVLGLMTLALIKASLVGYYFMHVKFEGKWVFAMIIPACVLAAIAVLALVPDIARDRSQDELIIPEDDSAWTTPATDSIHSANIFKI